MFQVYLVRSAPSLPKICLFFQCNISGFCSLIIAGDVASFFPQSGFSTCQSFLIKTSSSKISFYFFRFFLLTANFEAFARMTPIVVNCFFAGFPVSALLQYFPAFSRVQPKPLFHVLFKSIFYNLSLAG